MEAGICTRNCIGYCACYSSDKAKGARIMLIEADPEAIEIDVLETAIIEVEL